MANTSSPPETRTGDKPAVRPRDTVGDLLRRTRQEQGIGLEQVAGTLRIRSSYITAIEQCRYDRLPGPVYALGFVRTYANALGLDGDEAVRRFKLESAGLEQRADLAFPMPLTSRSVPGGRVVLVAFVLAVCAYAIWHYVSTGDRERPERVASVPSDLLPPAPPPAPSPDTSASAPAPASAAPAPAAQAAATPAPAPPQAAAPQPAATVATAPLPPSVSATPLPPPPAASQAPASAPGPALVAPPAPAALPGQSVSLAPPSSTTPAPTLAPGAALVPAPTASGAVNSSPPPNTGRLSIQLTPRDQGQPSADQTAAPPQAASADSSAPHVYGAVNGPSHITLLAKQDCWIQVRDESDPAQPLVAQRTLRKGDTYRVPDRSGLVLRTGNATGLQVMVDDRAVPALGGTVRTVALDPARLLSGNAFQ
ncbi:MAG TPA: RodZ domain-containing protein [Stellaceae bacterium]|nr:RodZ domain-containing protein [Stellaceae bacterium]